ncbi:MAG: tol-pal system YbgF family protein [Sandaracinaceae bacterium]
MSTWEKPDAGNCGGALAEFEAALALLRRPSILYNIARCQEQLNRYDLAVTAYRTFLEEAEPDDPDRARAEATVEQLGRLLGTIHVDSNVPAEVWLGDRVVGASPGDVLIPGGVHVIELRATDRLPERREVQVSAGSEVTIEVELSAAQEITQVQNTTQVTVDAPPLPVGLTVAMMGASVATLGVGLGFGVYALSLSDTEHARDARLPRDGDAIDEAALFADIFFIAGGVLSAATVAMAFLTDWEGQGERGPRVSLLVGPLFAGIRVEGIE